MSDNKLDKKMQQGLQKWLDRIWEDKVELRMQRNEIENELCDVDFNLNNEAVKWLKAQHWALGKALDALKKQEDVIDALLVNPNAFDEHESSDKVGLITKLKDEEAELLDKLNKLSAFLLDDDKTAKINDEQLRLLQKQQHAMGEYRRILVARIYNLEADKGGNNND